MIEKLEKCPFCGGEAMPAEVEQIEHSGWVGRIECGTCDAVFSLQYSANSPGKAGNEVIAAWNRRELESASHPGGGEADIIERFKNPMTPYGMLIRALRIVAGTTLMDMANHAGITPAHLSAIETGRKPLFHEDVVAASGYFHGLGIPGTLIVLERAYSVSKNAARAAPSAGNGGAEGV